MRESVLYQEIEQIRQEALQEGVQQRELTGIKTVAYSSAIVFI